MKLSQLNEAFDRLNEADGLRNNTNIIEKRYSVLSNYKNAIADKIENTNLQDSTKLSLYQELLSAVLRLTRELGKTRENSNREQADKELKYIDHYIEAIKKSIQGGKLAFESLNESFVFDEAMDYRYLDSDFNINDIESEFDKRKAELKELEDSIKDVEEHYINRYRYDLAVIRRMFEEDIKSLDLTDEDTAKMFFNDLDFRIKHAKKYIGLPG